MNVIFLDVDGVLNRDSTTERIMSSMSSSPLVGLDEELVQRFLGLLARVNALVVLSSTWRAVPDLRLSIQARVPIYDVTDSSQSGRGRFARGREIADWIESHTDVLRFAIIDDDPGIFPRHLSSLFSTSPHIGLTDEIVESVVAHLVAE